MPSIPNKNDLDSFGTGGKGKLFISTLCFIFHIWIQIESNQDWIRILLGQWQTQIWKPGPDPGRNDPKEEKYISMFWRAEYSFKKLEAFPVKPVSFLKEIYSFYYFTKIYIFFLAADEQIVKKKPCMLCPVLFLSLYCPSFP